jgi:hypothetical protein
MRSTNEAPRTLAAPTGGKPTGREGLRAARRLGVSRLLLNVAEYSIVAGRGSSTRAARRGVEPASAIRIHQRRE